MFLAFYEEVDVPLDFFAFFSLTPSELLNNTYFVRSSIPTLYPYRQILFPCKFFQNIVLLNVDTVLSFISKYMFTSHQN